jgi:hypothetical protein
LAWILTSAQAGFFEEYFQTQQGYGKDFKNGGNGGKSIFTSFSKYKFYSK